MNYFERWDFWLNFILKFVLIFDFMHPHNIPIYIHNWDKPSFVIISYTRYTFENYEYIDKPKKKIYGISRDENVYSIHNLRFDLICSEYLFYANVELNWVC